MTSSHLSSNNLTWKQEFRCSQGKKHNVSNQTYKKETKRFAQTMLRMDNNTLIPSFCQSHHLLCVKMFLLCVIISSISGVKKCVFSARTSCVKTWKPIPFQQLNARCWWLTIKDTERTSIIYQLNRIIKSNYARCQWLEIIIIECGLRLMFAYQFVFMLDGDSLSYGIVTNMTINY